MARFYGGFHANGDIWTLRLDGERKQQPFLQTSFSEYDAQFSPDGRWISFHAADFETRGAYVAPFREDTTLEEKDWIAVDGSGEQPRWSPDSKKIVSLLRNSIKQRLVSDVPIGAVMSRSLVMTSRIFRFRPFSNLRSLWVRIPTIFLPSTMTSIAE
jgi:hypothetical protein